MEHYWTLVLKDGTNIEIPPQYVQKINQKLVAREVIQLKQRTIPFSEIREFKQSEKRHVEQKLLEDSSKAFNEPVITKTGGVAVRWVKKEIPSDRWESYYSKSPGYQKLIGVGATYVAWRQPVHLIDYDRMTECNPSEIQNLDNKITVD